MRTLSKSFLYRHEVTNAAMQALLEAIKRFEEKNFQPKTADEIDSVVKGKWNRSTAQSDFAFSWNDDTASILRKINAADGFPGAICRISDECYFAYGACEEEILKGKPGKILAQRNHALCIATGDTSIWIQCLKKNIEGAIKLPAAIAIGNADQIAEATIGVFENIGTKTFREIQYEEMNEVGCLHFDFYNGAMSADQCKRLLEAFQEAKRRNTRVIVLMGGKDIWSNGIHLNMIEASDNPAQASWENIQAIDDLVREIACTETQYVISALQGNAGGGGVALALAADKVMARKGIVFNPHTRSMGLYGSEYWTYLLPRRIGTQRATQFTEQCLPWGTDLALEVKLIDECIEDDGEIFQHKIKKIAEEIASLSYFNQLLGAKKFKRNRDERYKPLENYRKEELEKMHRNFFDDDMNYNYKRYCFIHKINPEEETGSVVSRDLFSERRKIWRRRKSEQLFYEAS